MFYLIFSCFIIFLSSSNRIVDYREVSKIRDLEKCSDRIEGEIFDICQETEKKLSVLDSEIQSLKKSLADKGQYLSVSSVSHKMNISFPEKILFDSGKSTVRDGGHHVLEEVAQIIRNHKVQYVYVVGNTDSRPLVHKQSLCRDNWDLSIQRAISVILLLESFGVDATLCTAVGCAHYHPIDENTTAKGRENNRRVELMIHYSH